MIKKILLGLVILIAALCAVAASKSDDFNVTRSATISAPPAAVFKIVNDFHAWEKWSPWNKLDPQIKQTYEGPAAGVGAIYHWTGNNQVGEGTNRIVGSKLDEVIKMKLDFKRPMEGSNDVTFTFAPEDAGTKVTWAMAGKKNFVMKLAGIFMDCDKMCGDQFVEGLANLDKVASAPAAPKP